MMGGHQACDGPASLVALPLPIVEEGRNRDDRFINFFTQKGFGDLFSFPSKPWR